MAAERRVSIRLAAVDGDRVKAELMNIGREGKQALESIARGGEAGSAGVNRMGAAASNALRQMEALAERAARTAMALRAAGANTGSLVERIDAVTGAAPRIMRSAADIEAYGAQLDNLRARYNPLFAVINEYRNKLADIRQAHAVGAISANEMADAISRERRETLRSIAAIKGRSDAFGAASFQIRNLRYQMVDIAQGIPLLFQAPTAGLLNLANQGAQIAQIYGPEEGGVGRAFREAAAMAGRFALRLAPLALAVGAVAGGIAGMQHEINAVSNVTVSFGDVALATWQVIADGIYNFIKPAIDGISPWFSAAWDLVIAGTKFAGNAIVNAFRVSIANIKFVWNDLPKVIGASVIGAANATITGVEWMVNRAIDLLNYLSGQANSVLSKIPGLPENLRVGQMAAISIPRLNNPIADDAIESLRQYRKEVQQIAESDPLGGFFDAVKQRAIANALKPSKEELKKMAQAMEELRRRGEAITKSLRTPAEEYAATMRELRELLDANAISMETYGRAADQAAEKLRKLHEQERQRKLEAATDPVSGAIRALEEYARKAGDVADVVAESIGRGFKGAEDAVAQFVQKGKVDFGSLITSMLADMVRLSIRQSILGPLSGWLGGLLGGGIATAGVAHSGALIGGAAQTRTVSAMAFVNAPRLHGGGRLGPDEIPFIGQRGERVLNRQQTREWERGQMGGGITVNINGVRDAESFRQSRTQIAADLARAVQMGRRGS